MRRFSIISILFIFVLSPFFFLKFIIADTGIAFAFDYFLNKLELKSTQNIVSIKYNTHEFENSEDQNFKFKEIKGFGNKFISQKINKFKPSPDQLSENDEWIRSNGGNFSNKFSLFNQINKNNINNLKLEFKIDLKYINYL